MTESTFLVDEYVTTRAGEPYRLFPFGTIYKGGQAIEITPELARRFRLPHFKPPIKLGGHDDALPAGGHIVRLEVREDGLYAVPELNDNGAGALDAGAFRYHSPEVIWEGGGFEDPTTGELIEGPLIVGDALLHTPHLGEAAALYSVEIKEKDNMSDNTVTVPASLWDKIMMRFDFGAEQPDPQPEPEPAQAQDNFEAERADYAAKLEAVQEERDQYAAQLAELQHQQERADRVDRFAAELAEVAPDSADLYGILADLPEETAADIVRHFTAAVEQARQNVDQDLGRTEQPTDGDRLDAAIKAVMTEKGISYPQAFEVVRMQKPDLFTNR